MKAVTRGSRRLGIAAVACFAVLGIGWFCLPAPPLTASASFSQRVLDRDGRLLRVTLTRDEKYRLFTPLADIAPDLIAATLRHEDQYFWRHPGINPIASLQAGWRFARTRRMHGGASTLTMQLARMRYGIDSRTARGKLLQMWRALQIERHSTKREILETYLNAAPYGRNIEGVGAASLLYFGKPPAKLTRHEAIALSVVPQSPTRRALRRQAGDGSLAAAQNRLAARLAGTGAADDPLAREFIPCATAERAFAAPHFTRQVLKESAASCYDQRTTLDLPLQRMLERRIAGFVESHRPLGIANAAAMLVDSRHMEVLAQVGSADFFDEAICGQVDGTRARRSPGSTLKPFVYALGIDAGLIHPLAIVKDTPQSFSGYGPENFDGDFAGPITATESLARSRNVPAVALAAQLMRPTLYTFLKRGGVALPREESFYGLALPLGGGEVTMEELVRLYAALADGGRLRPLHRIVADVAPERGTRLLSPEAAFLTLDMLGHNPAPGLTFADANAPAVAWKTGTSHGFRDAWSIAVFDHYVLAVWVGNFDGHRNAAFVGRTAAGPLLFGIIDALRASGHAPCTPLQAPPGANLQRVEFCAVSGQMPTVACTHRTAGWMIPGVSPITTCEVHREVLVDAESGLRVPSDDGTRALRREVFEFWPSDLLTLFAKAGLPRRQPPPFLPGSSGADALESLDRSGEPPRITSPQKGRIYAPETDGSTRGAILLRAQTEADVAKLYWFADRTFLGVALPRESLPWHPTPGEYQLLALDDHGRSATCAVRIERAASK